MKKVITILAMALFAASSAVASPQSSMLKLLQTVADNKFEKNIPLMPLSEGEAKELADFLRVQYKAERGTDLDDTQAAIYAGLVCGMMGVKQASSLGENQANQPKKKPLATPDVNLFEKWPSGQTAIKSQNLAKMFEQNPEYTAQRLQDQKIAVVGTIQQVASNVDPKTGESKSGKADHMLLLDGMMCVLEDMDDVPIQKAKPGEAALLECRKIFHKVWPRGLCKIIGIGPKKDGVMDTWYTNQELKQKYLGESK